MDGGVVWCGRGEACVGTVAAGWVRLQNTNATATPHQARHHSDDSSQSRMAVFRQPGDGRSYFMIAACGLSVNFEGLRAPSQLFR